MHPAILLMGPTASGKSAVALELSAMLPVEIVSVDSAQVYRGMDIGTAKPDPATRGRVAHHLIDLIEPDQSYSAARFRADALAAMKEIRSRGRVPLLVGGTMLYVKALREGLSRLPQADARVRGELDRRAAAEGWPALHAELARVDPVTAARLKTTDSQRIQRALEVFRVSGTPLSALQGARDAGGAPDFVALALVPSDRAELASPHRRAFRRDARGGTGRRGRKAQAALSLDGCDAFDALRGLPPDLGRARGRAATGGDARAGHRSDPPARQAAAHLAALDAG